MEWQGRNDMQVLYFAWLRERVGAASEEIDPGSAVTARDLVDQLSARDPRYAAAFADMAAIRVAVDQEMCSLDTSISGAREIAFFPPVTGG
jgi:molybdopterin synthase sulfur carrier subunit